MQISKKSSCLPLVVLCIVARLPAQQPAQPSDKPLLDFRPTPQKPSAVRRPSAVRKDALMPCKALADAAYKHIMELSEDEFGNPSLETTKWAKDIHEAIYRCYAESDSSHGVSAMHFLHNLMLWGILNDNLTRTTQMLDKFSELSDKGIEKAWNLGFVAGTLNAARASSSGASAGPMVPRRDGSNDEVANELRLIREQLRQQEFDRRNQEARERLKEYEEKSKPKVLPGFSTGHPPFVHCTSTTIGNTVYTNCQ